MSVYYIFSSSVNACCFKNTYISILNMQLKVLSYPLDIGHVPPSCAIMDFTAWLIASGRY